MWRGFANYCKHHSVMLHRGRVTMSGCTLVDMAKLIIERSTGIFCWQWRRVHCHVILQKYHRIVPGYQYPTEMVAIFPGENPPKNGTVQLVQPQSNRRRSVETLYSTRSAGYRLYPAFYKVALQDGTSLSRYTHFTAPSSDRPFPPVISLFSTLLSHLLLLLTTFRKSISK